MRNVPKSSTGTRSIKHSKGFISNFPPATPSAAFDLLSNQWVWWWGRGEDESFEGVGVSRVKEATMGEWGSGDGVIMECQCALDRTPNSIDEEFEINTSN